MMALVKSDFEKDLIYLIQYPRPTKMSGMSPFDLKLETWLRMCDVKYERISNEFTNWSKNGMVPFIELNGEQMADSNLIIEHLPKKLGFKSPDDGLSVVEKAQKRALHALIEDKLFWSKYGLLIHDDVAMMLDESGYKLNYFVKQYAIWKMKRNFGNRAWYQGIGRHSKEEMGQFLIDDVKALSVLLGDKQYFFGDKPTAVDCTAFSHIIGFFRKSTLQEMANVNELFHTDCSNLKSFVTRMMTKFFPEEKLVTEAAEES